MIKPLWPYPAALVKTKKEHVLVVADLHIGWEMALSQKGIFVPTQTPKLLGKLIEIVTKYNPEKLLILGDVKHTVATAEVGEWHDIPDFFSELRTLVKEILIIKGNHDGNLEPLLPENIKLLPTTGATINNVGFFHGHRWPSPPMLKCKLLIMGHMHPIIAFRDPMGFRIIKQVWVKAKCDKIQLIKILLEKHRIKMEGENPEKTLFKHYKIRPKTEEIFIMPSFNDFLGGKPLNERQSKKANAAYIGPILRSDVVDMENAELYMLDGTFLGAFSQLKQALG